MDSPDPMFLLIGLAVIVIAVMIVARILFRA